MKYKVIIAPDSFKDSLRSYELCDIIEKQLRDWPEINPLKIPLADGGEGTIDALCHVFTRSKIIYFTVPLPTTKAFNQTIRARVLFSDNVAVIEMAEAAGIERLAPEHRNPMFTTTYSLGLLIKKVLQKRPEKIYLTLGGSATNDVGMGMAAALGFKFLDCHGKPVSLGARELYKIKKIEPPESKVTELIKSTEFIVLSDVKNPLYGRHGATYTYARQKGAKPKDLPLLEKGVINFNRVLKQFFGIDYAKYPGAGAAGGMGAGALYFLNARLESGAKAIMNLIDFERKIRDAQLIITGEGCIDSQTKFGKVVKCVADIAHKYKIPVVAIAGTIDIDFKEMKEIGANYYFPLCLKPMPLNECIKNTRSLLKSLIPLIVHSVFPSIS